MHLVFFCLQGKIYCKDVSELRANLYKTIEFNILFIIIEIL